ncbi:hypothetical protein EOPP23_21065 [Endozoicomonas sp. OPT23]|nr:hypothetical protein [Endozoicomonas sp. OPT23]
MEQICTTASQTLTEFERAACLEAKDRKELLAFSQSHVQLPEEKNLAPFPLIILLSGSSGTFTNSMQARREYWLKKNYAVMILDSFTETRVIDYCFGDKKFCVDYDQALIAQSNNQTLASLPEETHHKAHLKMLEAVTNGYYLLPAERIADLHLALDQARHHQMIDHDNIHLIGFSHGGTVILDALTMEAIGEVPPTMKKKSPSPLAGIRSVSVNYPNCGVGTYFNQHQIIPEHIPVFMAIAYHDEFVNPSRCKHIANRIEAYAPAYGWNLNSMHPFTLKTYYNRHAFDMQEYSEAYDATAARDLQQATYEFVSSHSKKQQNQ